MGYEEWAWNMHEKNRLLDQFTDEQLEKLEKIKAQQEEEWLMDMDQDE